MPEPTGQKTGQNMDIHPPKPSVQVESGPPWAIFRGLQVVWCAEDWKKRSRSESGVSMRVAGRAEQGTGCRRPCAGRPDPPDT